MYSATPPENVIWSAAAAFVSGSRRRSVLPPLIGAPPAMACSRRSAISAERALGRGCKLAPDLEIEPDLRTKTVPRLLDSCDAPACVQADKTSADIECR